MKNIVQVKMVRIGEGIPKICTSITGIDDNEIILQSEHIKSLPVDLIEWRADYYNCVDNEKSVLTILKKITTILKDKPLIFTFRSAIEGGEKELCLEKYFSLNRSVIESNYGDIIDIELNKNEDSLKELISFAHSKNKKVIVSNHDFNKTPDKNEIVRRLKRAQELGADIPKIAVMPNNEEDVIALLEASVLMKKRYAKGPFIIMSMAGKGLVSRIFGEVFGSDVTFAAAKKPSAPGQISVEDLRYVINLVNKNL